LLAGLSVLTALSCGGGGSSSSGATGATIAGSYVGTQTPGDFWTLEIAADNTGAFRFDAANAGTGYSYSGTAAAMTDNAAGFTRFTIETTDDPGLSAGDNVYGVVIPKVATVVAPGPFEAKDHSVSGEPPMFQFTSVSPPIFFVERAKCEDLQSGGTSNVIFMPDPSFDSRTDPVFYRVDMTYDNVSSTYGGTIDAYRLDNTYIGRQPLSTGTCDNGVLSFPDPGAGGDIRVSFTPSGAFFVDFPRGGGGMLGTVSDNAISAAGVFGKSFVGFYFNSHYEYADGTSSPEATPIAAKIAADGSAVDVTFFTDIRAGTASAPLSLPMALGTQVFPGAFHGTITDADGAHDAWFLVRNVGGKHLVFIVSDNRPSYHGYNVILMEK